MGSPCRVRRPLVALAASMLATVGLAGVAPAQAAAFPDVDATSIYDIRELADLAEHAIAGGAGVRLKAVSHGSSIEVRDVLLGLVVRVGQLLLPTGSQVSRPAYFVLDFRPGWFWTAAQPRELGVEASFRPTRHLGLTLGGYNNEVTYKAATSVVKDAIGRIDLDLGVLKAGGFLYVGTGRWLGDSIRFGVDGRTRLGPVEFTGQILRGAHEGIEQMGWYMDARHEIAPGLSLIARFDEHNPNVLAYSGLDLHGLLAIVHHRSPSQTLKLNFQASFADPKRVAGGGQLSGWAVIGQIWQRL